jgi:hypothetical protein
VEEARRRFEVWKGTFGNKIFGGHSALLTLHSCGVEYAGIEPGVVDHVDAAVRQIT